MATRSVRTSAISLVAFLLVLNAASCADNADGRQARNGTSSSTADATATTTEVSKGREVDFGSIETEYRGSGPEVVILGDSITVSSRGHLRRELDGYAVKIGALFGEGFGGGPFSALAASDRSTMAEVAIEYGKDDPAVAVLALGTNDAWTPELTLPMAEAQFDTMVEALGGACLVVVTITELATTDGYDRDEARAINDLLRTRADQVVDWNAVGSGTEYTRDDEIHLHPVGARPRARLIADAVEACAATA